MYDNVALCAWCDSRITYNPFTRTYKGSMYLFCALACLNDHYKETARLERAQPRLSFDVVV